MPPFLIAIVLGARLAAGAEAPATVQETVTLEPASGSWSLPGTLVLPHSDDRIPCVVFFAGSGPTDRDWLSPLFPGKNGSGRQLADGLAEKGIGSLRFDKVGSGANMEHLDVLSLAHYVDEASLAFDFLAARKECASVFLLGHSEGAFHATGAALAKQSLPSFGGLILMAGSPRSLLDTATAQMRRSRDRTGDDMKLVDTQLASLRDALRKLPDETTAPDVSHLPEAAALWKTATDERQGAVTRELLLADPLERTKAYHGPALVLAATHDAQVDPADADRLLAALGSQPDAKRGTLVADANHVFKREPRDPAQLPPVQIVLTYAEDGRPLADGVVDAIVEFVRPKQ